MKLNRTTQRISMFAAATAVAAGTAIVAAPAASANSFSGSCNSYTSFRYSDGADAFTVNSNRTGAFISASLKPISRSGPSVYISAAAPRGGHWSATSDRLKYAYEDTKYSYTVTCLSPNGNKIVKRGTFYS